MATKPLKYDSPELELLIRRKAMRAVAIHSHGNEDAVDLLQMLGLIDDSGTIVCSGWVPDKIHNFSGPVK